MRVSRFVVALLVLGLTGCGRHPRAEDADTVLTEHQRDSVLSKSDLPGARTVGRAMFESDRATKRSANQAAAMDSLPR